MPGLYVLNLGCKVNRVESDSLLALAQGADWLADGIEEASCIVVNTCTVTGEAQKKTRKAIHQALRANSDAIIIVTGCAAAVDPEELRALDDRVVIVPKAGIDSYVSSLLPEAVTGPDSSPTRILRVGDRFRTRVGIKVQDGCSHACTYCIVHVARGPVWSKPACEVLDEVRDYVAASVREIVLTGINLGSYADGRIDVTALVADALALSPAPDAYGNPTFRIRLSSIEPCDITDDLIELLATSGGRLCRHLHIPLQSGSSRVLREMARPYDAERFMRLIGKLRERVPGISLSTDIIVGFPGETDADFEKTLELARACRFSKIHVFPYSRREGTPAAKRTDQADPQVKRERCELLRTLSDELRAQDLIEREGSSELVLVERTGRGLTESYHELTVDESVPAGSLVRARLAGGACVVL